MPKTIPANQKAIDCLGSESGEWRIAGTQGLVVRCRGGKRTFMVIRKIYGRNEKRTLAENTLAAAKVTGAKVWASMGPSTPGQTLATVYEQFLLHRPKGKVRADQTFANYKRDWRNHLEPWAGKRSLEAIGKDIVGVEALQRRIRETSGVASANTTLRLFSALYRYAWKRNPLLPAPPSMVIELDQIPARNWALSADELKKIWPNAEGETRVQRMFWHLSLFTGARPTSIINIWWDDVDFDRRILFFRRAKGERVYRIPLSDALTETLLAYRATFGDTLGTWLLPGKTRGTHMASPHAIRGLVSPGHYRHTMRTVLAILKASSDEKKLLLGHTLRGVNDGYLTPSDELIESMRPTVNKVADYFLKIIKPSAAAAV